MDRITNSILNEFSIDRDLRKKSEEVRFEHLSSFLTTSDYLFDTFSTDDLIVGKGNDTGIDAISIIVNGSLMSDIEELDGVIESSGFLDVQFVFVQAERSANFDSAKIGTFGFGVFDFFSESPTLRRNAEITRFARMMERIYKASGKFKRGMPRCALYYVTTGKWVDDVNLTARIQSEKERLEDLEYFHDVSFIPLGASEIQKRYTKTKNAIAREFQFDNRAVVPDIPGVKEAYLGVISAKQFLRLIEDDNGEIIKSIFYDNVRDWQSYNGVNNGIKETLENPALQSQFALMNNGVTIIAQSLRITGNKALIEDYQIVNGCQTSHVLHDRRAHYNSDVVMVPIRVISTENDDVIAAITKATNQQTAVREEQLLALGDFQKKLEAFFHSFDKKRQLYYERRLRQYNGDVSIEKTRIVTPGGLIRTFAAMFLERSHSTTRSYSSLLEGVGKDIFVKNHCLDPYYVAALAAYRLEYLFRNLATDSSYKPARYQILYAFRMIATDCIQLPRMSSNECIKYCTRLIDLLWDEQRSAEMFIEATHVIDRVSKILGNDVDIARTQAFTDSVRKNTLAQIRPAQRSAKRKAAER